MEKQVAALVSNARGQKDEALKLAKEAMDIELALSAPSGPAGSDQAGAGVLRRTAAGGRRTAEAVAALELSLQRTPNRTPSVKAMAAGARSAGTAMR